MHRALVAFVAFAVGAGVASFGIAQGATTAGPRVCVSTDGVEAHVIDCPTTTTTGPTPTTAATTTTVVPPTTVGGVADTKPQAGGYFSVLPVGSAVPVSDAACASRVHQSTWEPRPDNTTANNATPAPNTLAYFSQWSAAWNANNRPAIRGNYHGTTDEEIQFYACKWGWSDELIRAEAISESTWHQSTIGDNGTSYGLMQIRDLYHPRVSDPHGAGSSWPNTQNSTAWNLDQFGAEMRGCYDGQSTYLGNTAGDVWGCIQSWFSGAWSPNGGGQSYQQGVRDHLAAKPWLAWNG